MTHLSKAFEKAKTVATLNKRNGRMSWTYTQCLGFLYLEGHLTEKEAVATENYLMSKNEDINILMGFLEFNEIILEEVVPA